MAQLVYGFFGDQRRMMELPPATAAVMPGVAWGEFDCLFTPAFWASQAWAESECIGQGTHRLGKSLREEAAACLLGGYGMLAEVGLAAFDRLRSAGLLAPGSSREAILEALSKPVKVGNRLIRYRFAPT